MSKQTIDALLKLRKRKLALIEKTQAQRDRLANQISDLENETNDLESTIESRMSALNVCNIDWD